MADKQKVIAIKPEQALAGLVGLVVFVMFFKLIFAFEESHTRALNAGDPLSFYHKHYDKLSVNTHFPGLLGDHESASFTGRLTRCAGYAPAALPLVFIAALGAYSFAAALLAKPETSLLEDPEFNIRHLGVDTPQLCHLPAVLHVCPERNRRAIVEAVVMSELDPYAPASSLSSIDDSPTTYAK